MSLETPIAMERWAKDHWSLLAYVETTCVDGRKVEGLGRVGEIDRRKLSCNPARHPLLEAPDPFGRGSLWRDEYSSRVKGEPTQGHDDWDCLDDLAEAGLVEILSLINGFVRLTPAGREMAGALRSHKAAGGRFTDFESAAAVPAGASV